MKNGVYLFIVYLFLSCTTSEAQQTYIYLDCGVESGMAYVQGYEYSEGCEFVIKDSCQVESGRGELEFTMGEDSFVRLLIVTDNHKYFDEIPIGPNDSLILDYTKGRMVICEDRRRYGNEYTRFRGMKDSIRLLYSNLQEQIYNERYGSRRYKQLEDSIKMVKDFYYTDFPYVLLNDSKLSQSIYIVHNAIAIRSIACAPLHELDSLRSIVASRLPHAKSITTRGDKVTERSQRDQQRFFELLNHNN